MIDHTPSSQPPPPWLPPASDPFSRHRYFYYDPDEDGFVEFTPRRLDIYARALALAAVAMILGSLIVPQLAL